ncbi:replication protein A 14 kDa subunit-like [Sitophilus oryzae]|uniref:Replication protein A 14 kDa subunit-like n=1 Tax=Sitophilus oryzae TaxID=7048 RepID=A0A6J2Y0A9_SITOR|nr:replication protein A 14 kDa subunit-like [Sitophilus oryzae]
MDNIRDFVNGVQLVRFVNKPVCMMGKVTSVSPNGMNFEIKSVDDVAVKVNVKEPINTPLTDHWVEVRGISAGKSINADDYTIFSNKDFDVKSHNYLCSLLYSVPNIYQTEAKSSDEGN